jgi:uncharacterized protein (DUF111 family)
LDALTRARAGHNHRAPQRVRIRRARAEQPPNVLRATLLGETADDVPGPQDLLVLESNLDDCNPEWLGALTADLLARGARDVWYTPAVMKRGVRHGAQCAGRAARADALCEWIFRSTKTFGIRHHAVRRDELARRFEQATTPWGR